MFFLLNVLPTFIQVYVFFGFKYLWFLTSRISHWLCAFPEVLTWKNEKTEMQEDKELISCCHCIVLRPSGIQLYLLMEGSRVRSKSINVNKIRCVWSWYVKSVSSFTLWCQLIMRIRIYLWRRCSVILYV